MGVYFIAAGNSSRNGEKTLDRAHRVEDLVPHVPATIVKRLWQAFPDGEGVYAWGGSDPRHQSVLYMDTGTYVVAVANETVKHVFRYAFGYRTPPGDTRIQNHFKWDDHKPLEDRRPYPLVYFLTDRMKPSQQDAYWFRDEAFEIQHANWLPGQRLFSTREVAEAMARTGFRSVEDFLGIATPQPSRERPSSVREQQGSYGVLDLTTRKRGEPEKDPEAVRKEARSGQGRGLTAPERRAVEHRAMEIAETYYSRGWDEVIDVSGAESYDLLCKRGDAELRVEVKGTTGDGRSILVTRNEVANARERYPHVALVVVYDIDLDRRAQPPTASGGTVLVFDPWNLDGRFRLEPETYRCVLPPRG